MGGATAPLLCLCQAVVLGNLGGQLLKGCVPEVQWEVGHLRNPGADQERLWIVLDAL